MKQFTVCFVIFWALVTLGSLMGCGQSTGMDAYCGEYTGDTAAVSAYVDNPEPTVWSVPDPDDFDRVETTFVVHNPEDRSGDVTVRCDFRVYPGGASMGIVDAVVPVCAQATREYTVSLMDNSDSDEKVRAFCKVGDFTPTNKE